MRYAKLSCINVSQLTYSHIGLLLRSFLGTGYLVFSGTRHGVRVPCGVVHDRARFFENHVLPTKWGK